MGLIEFVQNAGARLLGVSDELEEAREARSDGKDAAETMGAALAAHVASLDLDIRDLQVTFKEGTAAIFGVAASQADREKAVLAVGNVQGVAGVQDWMTVEEKEPEAAFYTVQAGDTLSAIAKTHYGNPSRYPVIFEANRPLLSDPDRIYPGQVLRIPVLEESR